MTPTAQLVVTRLHSDVKLPRIATPVSIGADVYAYLKSESGREIKMMIPPGMSRLVPTGIVVVAEPPFSLLACSRSGLANERNLFVLNAPGVIDPDYRGELKVILYNASQEAQWIQHEDRIMQLIMVPIPVPEISDSPMDLRGLTSVRGEAGFGSTGR
jgi:dUTP pyrophosphatase